MKLLVAAATEAEIQPTIAWLKESGRTDVETVITGIGLFSAAFALGKRLAAADKPALVLQAGIAGTFDRNVKLGDALLVDKEYFGDLGAEDNGVFRDLFGIGLWKHDQHPFTNNFLLNPFDRMPPALAQLPRASAVSVNTVSGEAVTIARLEQQFAPTLESMEGAALHYAGLMENVPFLQLRTVSNYVEQRDKSKWDIKSAVARLNGLLRDTINEWNNER
ncbi:futalosine hydrolase [Chitinophaga rhizosphaerae]|uniref:futalosine hydrolase n=1 Tax=Chitinophaga rhizosphaerae TaxID=1864947 RepID=UPI000F8118E4|nr:futalosine hydrolase [Chitinophaga rhizosphaerae]